ncbi:MAG: hypothetical protein WD906_02070, partial [Anaerolineales bacterium]
HDCPLQPHNGAGVDPREHTVRVGPESRPSRRIEFGSGQGQLAAFFTIDGVTKTLRLLTDLAPGMYLVNRQIQPGRYRGVAGTDFSGSC